MKLTYFGGACAAAVVSLNMAAFAQVTEKAPVTPAGAPQATAAEQTVTVTGCIQREADYRKARDAGRGGAAGSGVGVGNEFVLINAAMTPASAATGTAGTSGSTGAAFELTGSNESQADQHVGRRVEIMGKLKAADVAAGRPTGGPTAGKPPEGVDVAGKDLQLRELEISSIKQVAGTCPAS